MASWGLPSVQWENSSNKQRMASNDTFNQADALSSSLYDEARGYQQPWYDYGQNALKDFQAWGSDPNAITSDPSYKWRLGQGTNALENSAAARGGLLSGNTGKALMDYGQNAASQEYANEFGRWMQKLGIGTNASNNMSGLTQSEADLRANNKMRQGQLNYQNILAENQQTLANKKLTIDTIMNWGGGM